MERRIRKAVKEDAIQINRIANDNALKKRKVSTKRGFLVSSYNQSNYDTFIKDNEHFYVLETEGKVRAFLLAYKQEELSSDLIVNNKINHMARKQYCLIKQIAVDISEQHKGYGRQLYEYFMNIINEDIYTAIVMKPMNVVSDKFHKNLGFQCIGTVLAEDGMERGIYYWNNPKNDKYDKDILLNQYERAIELYLHEDNLNWSKMNHYLYISGGLVAILSFREIIKMDLSLFLLMISILGLIVSYIFFISIKSGIDYMKERKYAVVNIEKKLIELDGMPVVTNFNYARMRKSPTTKVMKLIPVGGGMIWLFVLIFILINLVFF